MKWIDRSDGVPLSHFDQVANPVRKILSIPSLTTDEMIAG
jgi:hypothetical protein